MASELAPCRSCAPRSLLPLRDFHWYLQPPPISRQTLPFWIVPENRVRLTRRQRAFGLHQFASSGFLTIAHGDLFMTGADEHDRNELR
jgi:hypothetical protein